MDKELKSVRFIFSTAPSLLARLDRWRAAQADVPGRSEAVRRLLEAGLERDGVA